MALKLLLNQKSILNSFIYNGLYIKSVSLRKINTAASLCMAVQRQATHRPNLLEKYLLVWMKKYPSVADVPKYVYPDMMEKVRNKSRIKLTIYFCVITAVVCVVMVFSGKRAKERGESLRKMNVQWHKEQDEKK